MTEPAAITAIYRYPVKGLSPEPLPGVSLAPGDCLPHDRRFAIALPSTEFDPQQPVWLPKTRFVMLMRDAPLAKLQTSFDAETGILTIEHADTIGVQACITESAGCRVICEYLEEYLGDSVERPLRIVEAPGHAFADARKKPDATSDKYVSLINLASIEALEEVVETRVDPLRFRANVYFAGPSAWRELEWIGSPIVVGGVRLRVVAPITRCAATQVNLETAERDLDIPAILQRSFGHNLMGIYGEVVSAGDIAPGDPIGIAARL